MCTEVSPSISVPYLSDVERGERPCPFNRLGSLADVYLLRGAHRARLYQLAGKLPPSVEQAVLSVHEVWGLHFDKMLDVVLKACDATEPALSRMARQALESADW